MTDIDVRPPQTGATPLLNKALSQLQGELPKITKSNTADIPGKEGRQGYKYSYADLADVTAAVGPLLAKYGLAFHTAPSINPANRQEMILTWSLLHESGEERTGEWPLGPVSTPPQTLGSRITYGRRYCLGSATGIVAEDDDDGQRAQGQHDGRQSAGDLWEHSTPARPARQQPRPANGGTATRGDGPSFYRRKLAEAADVKTDAAVTRLTLEVADAAKNGLCTPDQATHIQNRAELTLRDLKLAAQRVDVEDLAVQAEHAHAAAENGDGAPGDDRHRKLVGAVQAHFKRLAFTEDERTDRLWAAGKLAGTSGIESLNDLDDGELSDVAGKLAKVRSRAKLEELLAAAGDDGGDMPHA